MKAHLPKLIVFFLWISIFLSACTKDELFQKPIQGPGTPAASGRIQFAVTADLSGAPYHSSNLAAVVSIINKNNDTVVNEKLLALDFTGAVKTGTIELPAGSYKLTRFRLVYGSVNTHFATPLSGSAKAAQVEKPLTLAFQVKAGTTEIPVSVVRVQDGERPELFGYPSGAFDNGQSNADPYLKVKVKAIMQVGAVLYDSIATSLRLTTWHNNGEMQTTYLSLKEGINEVPILKSGTRFQLQVSKWGITSEVLLNRDDLPADTVYTFRGRKEARFLKSEITYRLVAGVYQAESKNEYLYDAAGRLSKINYYEKTKDNKPFIARTDVFEYNGTQVQKISRYNDASQVMRVTTFTYNAQGKLHSMTQNENGQITNATVDYSIANQQAIHYTFPGQSHTSDYVMHFLCGNMIAGEAYTSGRSTETARYSYDAGINPYAHMNWPDLFLTHSSQNNVTAAYKTYYEAHPAALPYHFSYTYNAEGYPTALVKQFQSYGDNNYMYTTKTVYNY